MLQSIEGFDDNPEVDQSSTLAGQAWLLLKKHFLTYIDTGDIRDRFQIDRDIDHTVGDDRYEDTADED